MADFRGKVYLVGAGLGGLEYITIQAHILITTAEVLVYDALVSPELIQLTPDSCEHVYVGKRGGQPSTSQAEINQLLVDYCQAGKQVIRLKSGDPFIFGRVSAEIDTLMQHGCDFQVVPGISSALAAPLLAGIPLTDPVLSRGFMVVTAHEPDALNWEVLAAIDTLVILMGGQQLPEILHQLQKHRRSLSTPIALIRWAGTPQQQVWQGTLENIQAQLPANLSPVVIVIGEVVKLRDYLGQPQGVISSSSLPMQTPVFSHPADNDPLPLAGQTILITRAATQASEFAQMLQAQGARVLEMPTLEIVPPSSWQEMDQAIDQLEDFQWLILTSANAVEYFSQRLLASGKDLRSLAHLKIAVVGNKTAASLQTLGINPDFVPPEFVADSLLANFPETLKGLRILFPRVETGGREILVQEMTKAGAAIVEVAAYQSRCPEKIDIPILIALQQEQIDMITFTSSKGVQYFSQMLQQHEVMSNMMEGENKPLLNKPNPVLNIKLSRDKIMSRVLIAAIGPQTAQSCQTILGRVDIEAQEYTLEGLTQAILLRNAKATAHYRLN